MWSFASIRRACVFASARLAKTILIAFCASTSLNCLTVRTSFTMARTRRFVASLASTFCTLFSSAVPRIPCRPSCSWAAWWVMAAVAATVSSSSLRWASFLSCLRLSSAFRRSSSLWALAAPSPNASTLESSSARAARVRAPTA